VIGPGPEKTPDAEREIEVGLFELIAAFRDLIEQSKSAVFKHEIETEQVTVRGRMMVVMELLEANESIEFLRIFESPGEEAGPPSRPILVATFLAVLELARLTALRIYQGLSERGTPEGPIRVRRAAIDSDDPDWRERITDSM
jgi:chromatin segregation and condensation protein Rec8/ScpA/Scc1 (kleisin family)